MSRKTDIPVAGKTRPDDTPVDEAIASAVFYRTDVPSSGIGYSQRAILAVANVNADSLKSTSPSSGVDIAGVVALIHIGQANAEFHRTDITVIGCRQGPGLDQRAGPSVMSITRT